MICRVSGSVTIHSVNTISNFINASHQYLLGVPKLSNNQKMSQGILAMECEVNVATKQTWRTEKSDEEASIFFKKKIRN